MASSDVNDPQKLTEDTGEDEQDSCEQEQNSRESDNNGNQIVVNAEKLKDSDPASADHHFEESSKNSEDGLQNSFEQGQNGKGPTNIDNKVENNVDQFDIREDIQPLIDNEQTQPVKSDDKSDDQIEVVVDQNGSDAEENPKETDKEQVEENNGEKEGLFRRLWPRVKKIVKMLKILAVALFSTAMYLFDVGSDIKLAVQYHNEGSMKYFWPTLAFIVIPFVCLVVQDLQMVVTDRKRWLSYFPVDKDKTNNNEHRGNASPTRRCIPRTKCYKTCSLVEDRTIFVIRIVISLLGLGFIVRKVQYVFFEIKQKRVPNPDWVRWYKLKKFEAKRDSHIITFVSSFMEDIPQSLLQLYVYVQNPVSLFSTIGFCIISSLLNLPLKYMNYYKSNRRHTKDAPKTIRPDLHIVATVVYYLAFLGAVVARMLSVTIFIGNVSFRIGISVLVLHYIGSILFNKFIQRPRYLGQTFGEGKWAKRISIIFNTLLFSMVNVFLYYDLSGRDGKGIKIIVNNLVIYIENCVFLILFVTLVENEYAYLYALAIGIGSFLHWSLLTAYYILLHPTQGMCKRCRKGESADEKCCGCF